MCMTHTHMTQVQSSEGNQLAMQQHQKQLGRALEKDASTLLSKVDSQQCYFETSSKTGEGVEELFRFIQKTVLAHKQRQGGTLDSKDKRYSKSSERSRGGSIRVGDDGDESDSPRPSRCCGGQ